MNIKDEIVSNEILQRVQEKFINQQEKGIKKYGETVNPESYSAIGWLNHIQQELIDGAVYAEVLMQVIGDLIAENKQLHKVLEEIN